MIHKTKPNKLKSHSNAWMLHVMVWVCDVVFDGVSDDVRSLVDVGEVK